MLTESKVGTSLVAQRLRTHTSNAGDVSSIPGWETEILCAAGQLSLGTML